MKHVFAREVVEVEPKTRQDIFDRVVRHYRAQRRRCPPEGHCSYRLGGDRCFVGALIDDAHYDREMEGYLVYDLLKVIEMPGWFRENAGFIAEIQFLHDTPSNWSAGRMDMVLELFAAERGLTMPA